MGCFNVTGASGRANNYVVERHEDRSSIGQESPRQEIADSPLSRSGRSSNRTSPRVSLDRLRAFSPPGGASVGALRNWFWQGQAVQHLQQLKAELDNGSSIRELLDGPGFGALLTHVIDDIASISNAENLSPIEAAEALRQAISTGRGANNMDIGLKNVLQFGLYAVREKLQGEAELADSMRTHPAFQSFPVAHTWKFCIEQERWNDHGAASGMRFDNEPGYMGGMSRGLKFVIDSEAGSSSRKKGEIDATWVENLHDIAVNGVFQRSVMHPWQSGVDADEAVNAVAALTAPGSNISDKISSAASAIYHLPHHLMPLAGGYRHNELIQFGLDHPKNLTPAGLGDLQKFQSRFAEWAEFRSRDNRPIDWDEVERGNAGVTWACPGKSRKEVTKLVQNVLRTHYHEIKRTTNAEAALHVVARTCATLERAHVFMDGNARTFGCLLLNKLLLSAGLSPSMAPDANEFDGYSNEELVARIREGQDMFRAHCQA